MGGGIPTQAKSATVFSSGSIVFWFDPDMWSGGIQKGSELGRGYRQSISSNSIDTPVAWTLFLLPWHGGLEFFYLLKIRSKKNSNQNTIEPELNKVADLACSWF